MQTRNEELIDTVRWKLSYEDFPLLRGVAAEWNQMEIVVHFYHDGELDDEIIDGYQCMGTEIISYYGEGTIDERINRLDKPQPLPFHELWAFKEEGSDRFHRIKGMAAKIDEHKFLGNSIYNAFPKSQYPLLRGVAIDWDQPNFPAYFYHAGPVADEVVKIYSHIADTQVFNCYPVKWLKKVISCEKPEPLPRHKWWAFGEPLLAYSFLTEEERYQMVIDKIRSVIKGKELPFLLGIAVLWKEDTISLYFYHKGEVTKETFIPYDWVTTKTLESFDDVTIEFYALESNVSNPIPHHEWWAFRKPNCLS